MTIDKDHPNEVVKRQYELHIKVVYPSRLCYYNLVYIGSMPERLMGTDCKSVSIAYVGSNPTRPNNKNFFLASCQTGNRYR